MQQATCAVTSSHSHFFFVCVCDSQQSYGAGQKRADRAVVEEGAWARDRGVCDGDACAVVCARQRRAAHLQQASGRRQQRRKRDFCRRPCVLRHRRADHHACAARNALQPQRRVHLWLLGRVAHQRHGAHPRRRDRVCARPHAHALVGAHQGAERSQDSRHRARHRRERHHARLSSAAQPAHAARDPLLLPRGDKGSLSHLHDRVRHRPHACDRRLLLHWHHAQRPQRDLEGSKIKQDCTNDLDFAGADLDSGSHRLCHLDDKEGAGQCTQRRTSKRDRRRRTGLDGTRRGWCFSTADRGGQQQTRRTAQTSRRACYRFDILTPTQLFKKDL